MSAPGLPPTGEVLVWRIRLDSPAGAPEVLAGFLSDDERARAAAQAGERRRWRFVAAHAAMRRILGASLDEDPRALRFVAGAHGKPRLEGRAGLPRINLAHSGELALLAVALEREVGVDVEWIDPRRDLEAIARAFTSEERIELGRLPENARRAAGFGAWARKEACLKAAGRGLTGGYEAVQVSVDPSGPPRVISFPGGAEEAARWTLVDVDCGAGYRGALAAEGAGWLPRVLDAPND